MAYLAQALPDSILPPTTIAPPRWSVRAFLAWLVLACLLPGIIGAATLFIYEYREGVDQLERNTIQTARALAQAMDNQILRVQSLAQGLASADSVARGDLAAFHRQARRALEQSRQGINVVLADRDGRQLLNTAEAFGRPLPRFGSPELVRRVFESGEPVVSDVFNGTVLRRPLMAVSVPVRTDGKVAYALIINVLPESFNNILSAQGLPPGWVATILDSTGTIAARSRAPETFVGQKPAEAFLLRFMESREGTMKAVMKDGVPVLSAYTLSPVTRWRVAISIPQAALAAELNQSLAMLALGIALLFAIGLGLAWQMGGKIARSFRDLMAPAFALGSGESLALPPQDVKEAGELASALEKAALLLKERTAALEETNRSLMAREGELADAHRLAKFGTWLWNLKSGEVTASKSLHEIYGREIPPFPEQKGTLLPAQSWEQLRAAAEQAVRTGGGYDLEFQVNHGSGATIWVNAKCAAIRDDGGEVVALHGTIQDITERKAAEAEIQRLYAELEQRVQTRTAQLKQSNEALLRSNMELQHFAHAAAHDLQTPLRSIVGFTQLLQRELQGRVDDRAAEWLNLVIDNTKRLQTLIRELLAYIQLEDLARPLEEVDLREVFEQVLAILATVIGETRAEVSCGDLPTVTADRSQMAQLLQNLIENGIKYNRSKPPKVRLTAERRGNEWLCAVADNGMGIEPRHQQRIFDIFRRLHSHREIPGTGIGLAVCQRIVERHGGRIWVESEPGKGSVFYFSLPVRAGITGRR